MQSTERSSFSGSSTCKLCNPRWRCQTLMPENFARVVESDINGRTKTFFVVKDGLMFGGLGSIPFEPLVDPGPYVCFNCWGSGHSHMKCRQLELRYFCQNCGRRDATMSNCPRCALAYLDFGIQRMKLKCRGIGECEEFKQLWPPMVKVPLTICEVNDEAAICTSFPTTQYPMKEIQTKSSASGPLNLYFKTLRDVVVQSIHEVKTPVNAAQKRVKDNDFNASKSCPESTASSGIGDECLSDEEDEDLDQIVVDENEKLQPRRPPSDGVREFLNLMDAVKHLPIDVQSSVALQFVRKRRVLMNERKDKV